MAYRFGARSRAELKGVHPDLFRAVERAIEITRVTCRIGQFDSLSRRRNEAIFPLWIGKFILMLGQTTGARA